MEFLPKTIEKYSQNHTEKEPKLLKKLNIETWAQVMTPRILSGHIQGRALSMFSKMINPQNIIEVGTYTGYSALCLAEGLTKSGSLHTIDINEETSSIARRYFDKSEFSNKIYQHKVKKMEVYSIDEAFLDFS